MERRVVEDIQSLEYRNMNVSARLCQAGFWRVRPSWPGCERPGLTTAAESDFYLDMQKYQPYIR